MSLFTDEVYTYDASGMLEKKSAYFDGCLDDVAVYTYEYDVSGRVTKCTTNYLLSGDEMEASQYVTYEYDANGNLLRETPYYLNGDTYEKGAELQYVTENGRIVKELHVDSDYVGLYDYDANGKLKGISYRYPDGKVLVFVNLYPW